MAELVDGVFTQVDYNGFPNTIVKNNTKVYNGKIYSTIYESSANKLVEVKLPAGGGAGEVTFQELTINNTASFNSYAFYGATLFKTSYESEVYSTNSFQLTPEIQILAGETTGTITFTSIDDTVDEANETIIVTPGTAINATNSEAAVTVSITDNDEASSIVFGLSAATIVEGAGSTVTLTATAGAAAEAQGRHRRACAQWTDLAGG